MWLPRQLAELEGADRPVLLVGGEAFGTPFLLDALRVRERTAWWTLARRAVGDEIAQGNALAAALNGVLDAPLFGGALPYRTHLRTLEHHARDLAPLWIVVTTERADAPVIEDLVDLQRVGYRVVVDWRGDAPPPPLPWVARCLRLCTQDLRLRLDEAGALAPGALDEARVAELWRATQGRFTEFLARAHEASGVPALLVPSPTGPLVPEAVAEAVPPPLAVRALVREGALVEALELAVLAAPELVSDLLRQSGPAYQERGLTRRLHLLLSALTPPFDRHERVLEWRLVAAAAVGELAAVIPAVDAHLDVHDAPELRARRAGAMPHPHGFSLAQAAVDLVRTPLTLWQYGRLHPDHRVAVGLLEESVRIAEDYGTPFDVARNAGALGARLLAAGEFVRARTWLQWGLQTFDQNRLRDGARRHLLVNDLAFARVLLGDLAGLRPLLADAAAALDDTLPGVALLFRSTRANVELVSGLPGTALELLEGVVAASPRARRGVFAHQLVRVLNELGRHRDAERRAADTLELASGAGAYADLTARLARGMADAVGWAADGGDAADPRAQRAADDLLEVMLATSLAAEERLPAALHYLLVSGGAGHNVPADLARTLGDLQPAALHLFSGPAHHFRSVWDTLSEASPGLRLRFFGEVACRIDGADVPLPARLAEIALALTLHPAGLGRDALNDFLTPEGQPAFTNGGLRSLLTRLRAKLPVTEVPYRWAVPFSADVVDVGQRLAAGRAREAIALWQGPLLPASDAPGVVEARSALEEALRQVALLGRDPDALYDLADRLGDDLELWEAAASALPSGDPRLALAHARCRRLAREYG